MAQFDLHRIGSMLVVDVQTDLIGLTATRIVAPLRPTGTYVTLPRLTPQVTFEGESWVIRLQEMAAVTAAELGQPVGSILELQDEIKTGIDVLIRGF